MEENSIRKSLDPEKAKRPISWASCAMLLDTLMDVLKPEIREIKQRLDALEARGVKYVGVFQRAAEYKRGDVVTHANAAWVALKDVPSGTKPGDDAGADFWQLFQKEARP